MKKLCLIIPLFISSLGFSNSDQNLEALKEWIATKRALTIDERGGALSISGDVRFEYIALSEQQNGIKNLGSGSLHPFVPDDQFDIEMNFMVDYKTDITWVSTKVEYDNNMGIFNGTFSRMFVERAFFGFRLYETDLSTTDLEFGRRYLGYTFDSKIQFGAIMDGILLKYNLSTTDYGDFYLFAAPFVVDEQVSHISFVMEMGLLNIMNSGFYAKYSLIDWDTKTFDTARLNKMHEYINSEFILGYRFRDPLFDAVAIVYASFLINAAAERFAVLNNRKDNMAGYIGLTMGEIRKRNDWSIDINFQFVQPQAIPYFDFSGIGIQNPDNANLFFLLDDGPISQALIDNAISNSNYWGFRIAFLYALQDTITLSQNFYFSRPLMNMSKKFDFQKYKLELIYAW